VNVPIILLVEDNRDDEELTLLALESVKIRNEVVVVRDGQEALDYLLEQGKYADLKPRAKVQVVLLDLNLPKVSGVEVLRALRAHKTTAFLPVVVLTSSREDADVVASYQLGCNSFIQKPVDFEKFVEAVKSLSMYWLVLNQGVTTADCDTRMLSPKL
jgi:two-component system response regulator